MSSASGTEEPQRASTPVPSFYQRLDDIWGDTAEAVYSSTLLVELVKQLRPGVDLTKIAIPATFFSPRSLLEMFADMFSHQHLFLRPATLADPIERFLGVTQFYFSQLFNGSGVKKSYNPILGEVFRCAYVHEDFGPTTLVAEQVCHHPPISAITVRNEKARVRFRGSSCAKPTFNGTSIGATPEGLAILTLEEWKENYHITYPPAWVRGIVIGPLRFEFATTGPSVFMSCPETGLQLMINFVAKGYFSGDWDTIQASVFREGEAPLFQISGHWNNTLYLLNKQTNESSVFVKMEASGRFRKQRPPWHLLEDHESCKVWAACSDAIMANNMQEANAAKHTVEQGQRNLRKAEKDEHIEWSHRLFTYHPGAPLPYEPVDDERIRPLFSYLQNSSATWTPSTPASSSSTAISSTATSKPDEDADGDYDDADDDDAPIPAPSKAVEEANLLDLS
jgi:hypothetical protein